MRQLAALFLLSLAVSACAGAHRSACDSYFPSCERDAPRPACQSLVPADSSVYALRLDLIVGRVPPDELARIVGTREEANPMTETFTARAAEADDVWYYDASGIMEGSNMRIGEEGLLALKGCVVLARQTLVIHN